MDSILPVVEHHLALGRDVVPTICGTIPCVGVPLATAASSRSAFGGTAAVLVRRRWIHNCLRGLGRLGHDLYRMLNEICRRVKIRN